MPASASPKPNVPLLDSMIGAPGRRSPGASALDHVHCGTILDAARVEALELCPESAMIVGEGFGDAQDRGVAHRRGERRGRVMAAQVSVSGCVPVNGMKGDNRGHRMVTSGPGRGVKRGR